MSPARMNLLTACLCLAASLLWVFLGKAPQAAIWVLLSLVWLGVAIYALARRDEEREPEPAARLRRRFYRLLSWFT